MTAEEYREEIRLREAKLACQKKRIKSLEWHCGDYKRQIAELGRLKWLAIVLI